MSAILDPVNAGEALDVAEPDALDVVELGDAIEETKQFYVVPIIYDSQHTVGWA